jgi:hypothetical protein
MRYFLICVLLAGAALVLATPTATAQPYYVRYTEVYAPPPLYPPYVPGTLIVRAPFTRVAVGPVGGVYVRAPFVRLAVGGSPYYGYRRPWRRWAWGGYPGPYGY